MTMGTPRVVAASGVGQKALTARPRLMAVTTCIIRMSRNWPKVSGLRPTSQYTMHPKIRQGTRFSGISAKNLAKK